MRHFCRYLVLFNALTKFLPHTHNFERFCNLHGVKIKEYIADNNPFHSVDWKTIAKINYKNSTIQVSAPIIKIIRPSYFISQFTGCRRPMFNSGHFLLIMQSICGIICLRSTQNYHHLKSSLQHSFTIIITSNTFTSLVVLCTY